MNIYEIPLSAASTNFQTTILGVVYTLTVTWRDAAQTWFLDIADNSGNAILSGLPMIPGADLLAQYRYLQLGFQLQIGLDANAEGQLTYSNLGSDSHLYVVTP